MCGNVHEHNNREPKYSPVVKSFIVAFSTFHIGSCTKPGLGIRSFDFRANRSFLPKNEQMSDSLKKKSNSLIRSFFGERPERFTHDRSFPLSDLGESLMVAHFW